MVETQNDYAEFCEGCMYDSDCPWYGCPRLEYVGDELDEQLTTLHNINTKDNATSGSYKICIYNDYLLEQSLGLTDQTFEEWEKGFA